MVYNDNKTGGEVVKLGGYAHSNGVTFFCDVLKIRGIKSKREINYKIDWILPKGWLRRLEGKFFLNGLLVMYYQWRVINNKFKALFVGLISLLLLEDFFNIVILDKILPLHIGRRWIALGIIFAVLINSKKIIRTLQYHGAEHKVINCYIKYGYLDKYLVQKSSRFNKRCGSNLGLIMLILYGIAWALNLYSLTLIFFIFLISIQIMKKVATKKSKWDKYINVLQWITVLEPKEEDIDLAINAFHKLQQAYDLYKKQIST